MNPFLTNNNWASLKLETQIRTIFKNHQYSKERFAISTLRFHPVDSFEATFNVESHYKYHSIQSHGNSSNYLIINKV